MPTKGPTHYQRTRLRAKRIDAPRRYAPPDPFYLSSPWRRFRGWVLARSPLCADPFGYHAEDGRQEAATEVHHLIRRLARPDLALDPGNVQPLCKSCHSRLTARERHHGRSLHHAGER